MTDRHLKFLDFVLQKLSENYEIGDTIDSIAYYYEKETGVNFPEEDIQPFEDSHEDTYFKRISNVGLMKITPWAKNIIDTYGSLSKYLSINDESQAREKAKLDEKAKLETEVLKLQKENLEYLSTIRDKEEIIRNLEIRLKRIELIKQYRWFIGFILTSCTILGVLLDRLLQLLWP